MFSFVQRFVAVTSIMLATIAVVAGATAASSIVREWVLRPRPLVRDFAVAVTPVVRVNKTSLMPADASLNLYAINGSMLESNVAVLGNATHMATDEHGKRVALQPMRRYFDRVYVTVNGSVDFAPCWDWNTKSIFVAVIARYRSTRARVNEVLVLDAMLRGPRHVVTTTTASTSTTTTSKTTGSREQDARAAAAAAFVRGPHDHPSIVLDHTHHRVYFNNSFKYPLDDLYSDSLAGTTLTMLVRYQVFSYSGYTPVHEVAVHTDAQTPVTVQVPRSTR